MLPKIRDRFNYSTWESTHLEEDRKCRLDKATRHAQWAEVVCLEILAAFGEVVGNDYRKKLAFFEEKGKPSLFWEVRDWEVQAKLWSRDQEVTTHLRQTLSLQGETPATGEAVRQFAREQWAKALAVIQDWEAQNPPK